jgi:hypothetical protein
MSDITIINGYESCNVTMHELAINEMLSLNEGISYEIRGSYVIKINATFIWIVTPCSFVDTFQHFEVTC